MEDVIFQYFVEFVNCSINIVDIYKYKMYRFKCQGLFLDRNRCLMEREKTAMETVQTLLEKI